MMGAAALRKFSRELGGTRLLAAQSTAILYGGRAKHSGIRCE